MKLSWRRTNHKTIGSRCSLEPLTWMAWILWYVRASPREHGGPSTHQQSHMVLKGNLSSLPVLNKKNKICLGWLRDHPRVMFFLAKGWSMRDCIHSWVWLGIVWKKGNVNVFVHWHAIPFTVSISSPCGLGVEVVWCLQLVSGHVINWSIFNNLFVKLDDGMYV